MTKIAFLILVLCSAIHCRISITSVPTPLSGFADDNPYWDEETQSVYFGDVFGQLLFRYSYKENRTYSTTATGIQNPAFFMPIANRLNRYLVGVNGSGVILNWNGRSSSSSIEGIAFTAPNGQWLNSASTTANGDLYIGTYSAALCTADPIFPFYRYSQSSGLVELSNGFKSLVGSALIEKTNTMKENSVLVQVGCTGNLSDKREVIHLNYSEDYFLPGLTADTNGDLYCGVFNGSRVIKINPRIPDVVEEYTLPIKLAGAPTFGGPNHDILYVTSGTLPNYFYGPDVGTELYGPPSGNLYILQGLGARRFPTYRPRI